MTHSTNYTNTFITVSADCPVTTGTPPARPGSIADRQFTYLSAAPGTMTSDDLLRAIESDRKGDEAAARLFDKPQACLRASPLVKTHGYGLWHDADSRVTLIPMESAEYARLLNDPEITRRPGMRSSRA